MAIKTIFARLDKDGALCVTDQPKIGDGENLSVGLEVQMDAALEESLSGASYFLEFKSVRGNKYISKEIMPAGGKLVCGVLNCVLDGCGEALVQVVARKEEKFVFKSQTAAIFVEGSVNAKLPAAAREEFVEYLVEFLRKAASTVSDLKDYEALLDETNEAMLGAVEDVKRKMEDGSLVGPKGDRGFKGDKGDSGVVTWGDGQTVFGNVAWEVI